MFRVLAIGFLIIAINVILQALVSTKWTKTIASFMAKKHKNFSTFHILRILIVSFLLLTLLHTLHAMVWASFLYMLPQVQPDFGSFHNAVYYSIVTFTTLGYGDVTLNSKWKLLSGIEAINGIMLIGWSTALMYSLMQNIFKTLKEQNARKN